jgi:hypothetical protein
MVIRKLSSYLAAGALAFGVTAASPAAAGTQPRPGHLFRISSCITCVQHGPAVAGNASGGFIASWDGLSDAIHLDVLGRVFNASLIPLEDDFDVEPSPADTVGPPQFDGAAASDTQGNFILAWASVADDQSVILARRFDSKGNPLGDPIEVASDPASSPATPSDFKPAVAATPDGGFVVAWVALVTGDQPPGPPRVMSRRYDATGAPKAPAVQLSTGLALGDRPSLCVSSTGRVHVAWTFADLFRPFEPSLVGVAVRRVTPAGVLVGPEQVVAPALAGDSAVAISCGPSNSYVVAWHTDQAPATSGTDIVAQRFNRRGAAAGAPFLVNQSTDQDQKNPALFEDATGAFVVVWEGNPAGVNGVRGRRFGGDGSPLSAEFPVFNAGQGDLSLLRPAISGVGAQGGFVVAVDAPGGLVGRVFSVTATAKAAAGAAEAADVADVADAVAAAEAAAAGSGASTGNGRGAGGLW